MWGYGGGDLAANFLATRLIDLSLFTPSIIAFPFCPPSLFLFSVCCSRERGSHANGGLHLALGEEGRGKRKRREREGRQRKQKQEWQNATETGHVHATQPSHRGRQGGV